MKLLRFTFYHITIHSTAYAVQKDWIDLKELPELIALKALWNNHLLAQLEQSSQV